MSAGLYPGVLAIERFASSPSGTLSQAFVVPDDLEIIGLLAYCGTAPGGATKMTINVSNNPISQASKVAPYNLWTATNVPSITGTAVTSYSAVISNTVINNNPYAHNYPLPGPSGTSGFTTAQSTSQTTETPVTSPPTMIIPTISALVAPDNTYTDINGFTGTPAKIVKAGDVLSFVIANQGSTANLEIVLYAQVN